ncbi:hypothetical protein ACFOD9_06710 [Novosphingobium bradum]|uniref:SnoaL-like domain-containing protein n=1 Tax=Novosphingobium bradum TaxID=1737444 RepID=A0ABV7IUS0_9SPHN
MPATELQDDIDRFYSDYGRAFTARDLAALGALCEFPLLLADSAGIRQIEDAGFFSGLFERFARSTWATTRIDGTSKFAMGEDGAMLTIAFTRLREDGSELAPEEIPFPRGCSYFLRRRGNGWKLVGLAEPIGR